MARKGLGVIGAMLVMGVCAVAQFTSETGQPFTVAAPLTCTVTENGAPVATIPIGVNYTDTKSAAGTYAYEITCRSAVTITVTDPSPHASFDALTQRPGFLRAWSLRDQTQLNSLVPRGTSYLWRYPAGAAHPYSLSSQTRDAAMLAKPPRNTFDQWPELAVYGTVGDENVPGNQSIRLPLGGISSGVFTLRFDVNWGPEVQDHRGTVDTFKTFFLFAGDTPSGRTTIVVMKDGLRAFTVEPPFAPEDVSRYFTETIANGLAQPAGTVKVGSSPVVVQTGQGALPSRGFVVMEDRWTRYAIEVRLNQPGDAFTEWSATYLDNQPLTGTWDMLSIWLWDEDRDPERVIYRIPIARKGTMYTEFRLNWDTSSHNKLAGTGLTGPFVVHARDAVLLTDPVVEGDPVFFERPR